MVRISFQSALQASTVPLAILGARASTPDGSEWVYGKLNEAALQGHVVVPVADTGVDTVSSSTDGSGLITVITKAGATWTVGQFADAWLVVDDGTGEGQVAKIRTNDVTNLYLYPQWALGTALAVADSDITISTYNTLWEKAAITSKIQNARGILQVGVAQNSYAWALSKGPGIVIAGEVLIVGSDFTTGDDTEGEVVKGVTAKGPFDEQTLGVCISANSTVDKGALVGVGIAL